MPIILLVLLLSAGTPLESAAQAAAEPGSWRTLPEALEAAAQSRRPVLVYVHAPWCGPCRRMERTVFPEVEPLLARFERARLDFDDHEARIELGGVARSPFEWARRFGADSTPAFVLLDADGVVVTQSTGFLDARSFGLLLAYVATGAYRHATFEHYARRAYPER